MSVRRNGDRRYGAFDLSSADLHRAGTPPVCGLSTEAVKSQRIAGVRPGDELTVERDFDHWVVSDERGYLGTLLWFAADDGKNYSVNGAVIRLPARGTLHVKTIVTNRDGCVIDFGGVVFPMDVPEPDGPPGGVFSPKGARRVLDDWRMVSVVVTLRADGGPVSRHTASDLRLEGVPPAGFEPAHPPPEGESRCWSGDRDVF